MVISERIVCTADVPEAVSYLFDIVRLFVEEAKKILFLLGVQFFLGINAWGGLLSKLIGAVHSVFCLKKECRSVQVCFCVMKEPFEKKKQACIQH